MLYRDVRYFCTFIHQSNNTHHYHYHHYHHYIINQWHHYHCYHHSCLIICNELSLLFTNC